MDFGIFHLMQQRHATKSAKQVIDEAVEHTTVAEELGYTKAWYPEHHFSNYSVCPSPLMMVAHMAARTTRIRLGSAVVVAPLYTPARLLAEIGFADALSDGRLELGIGPGYQGYEFDRFGVDLADSPGRTAEIWDLIEKGLTQKAFEHSGEHYQLPTTAINIRPVQEPLPPISYAGLNPDFIRRTVRGDHTLMISGLLGGLTRMKRMRDQVEAAAREENKDPSRARIAIARLAFVSKDRKEVEHYAECARYMQRIAVSLKNRREKVSKDYMIEEEPYPEELPFEAILANLPAGDVEHCVKIMVRDIKALRPTHIMLQMQMGDMDHKAALRSLELWATEVIPGIEKELGVSSLSEFGAAELAQTA